jgi:SAM-dependent methyltransferase
MMVEELVDWCIERHIRLDVKDGYLRVNSSKSVLCKHTVALIKSRKGELVSWIERQKSVEQSSTKKQVEKSAEVRTSDHRVKNWNRLFDDIYTRDAGAEDNELDFNISGWTDSYTYDMIPDQGMQEWVDGTVDVIKSMAPHSLLEIGCGTGMLLCRYGLWCKKVQVSDISAVALKKIASYVARMQWKPVNMYHVDALSIDTCDTSEVDTVVINSVVQYFPSGDYLREVITKLLPKVVDGGNIMIGDVRNLDLHDGFAASVEWSLLQREGDTLCNLPARTEKRLKSEEELLISPTFFKQLERQLDDIACVDIQVKRGTGKNELMKYRYDVIIRKKGASCNQPVEQWESFSDMEALEQLLHNGSHACFGVSGIANTRIKKDLAMAELLARHNVVDDTFKQRVNAFENNCYDGLELLFKLAESQGYQMWPTWSQDGKSQLDVIFSKGQKPILQARSAYTQDVVVNYPN